MFRQLPGDGNGTKIHRLYSRSAIILMTNEPSQVRKIERGLYRPPMQLHFWISLGRSTYFWPWPRTANA